MLNPLSKRPAKTVLVDTGTVRFRVDLSRKVGQFSVIRVIAGADASATESQGLEGYFDDVSPVDDGAWATALLRAKPRPSAEVKLLSVKVATAVMEVPILRGESEVEAVAMELESLTGLNTLDTQWAWKHLSGDEATIKAWAIQTTFEQLIAWRKAVSAIRGCHLAAVCHPSGIPLEAASQLELWPGFALYRRSDDKALDLRGWLGDEATANTFDDEAVREMIARQALLVLSPGGNLPEEARGSECTVLRLEEEAGRLRWAGQLARALDSLSQKLETLPRMGIPKPEMSTRQLALRTAAITGVAALLAIGHFAYLQSSKTKLEAQVAAMREPVDEVRDGKKEIQDLQRQLRALKSGPDEAPFDIDAHRSRMASLLHALADAVNEDVVVRSLESRGLRALVAGVSATSTGPANYVRSLNEGITALGWRATLAGREATLVHADGGPWTFTVELAPSGEKIPTTLANAERRRQ